jgi:hypothetical protein
VIDFYASEPHYADHLAPIWFALPAEQRGTFHVEHRLAEHLTLHGIEPSLGRPRVGGSAVVVAGWSDSWAARSAGRRVVYVEHGAGQTYTGGGVASHPSYSGGSGHDGTVLFLSPSETVAGRWRAEYPYVPAAAVGCPKLDRFHAGPPRARARTLRGAAVAITFHSDVALCTESRSAWRHYDPGLSAVVAALRDGGAHVLGHAHPRLWRHVAHRWQQVGAEPVVEALADPPWLADRRAEVVAEVYAACDGKAAERAADAILGLAS